MSVTVTTSNAADADISETFQYLATESYSVAADFREDVFTCFERIGEHPDIGVQVSHPRAALRRIRVSGKFENWLVFYRRLDEETIEVARLLHGARNIRALLRGVK